MRNWTQDTAPRESPAGADAGKPDESGLALDCGAGVRQCTIAINPATARSDAVILCRRLTADPDGGLADTIAVLLAETLEFLYVDLDVPAGDYTYTPYALTFNAPISDAGAPDTALVTD
jgi:hypothetical protein